MKFIFFFIFIPLVSSELHSFITTYTGIHGKTAAETPEFVAVTSLDGQQIDYYDSDTMKLIPKQDWMKEFASKGLWKEYIKITEKQQQIYKNNIDDLMQRFSQSDGVHTFQRRYGCDYDDETGKSHGFDEYAYDGEDFISLDLTEHRIRYITAVSQAMQTVEMWNNDKVQFKTLQEYFEQDCVYWLRELLHSSKAAFKKTDPLKVYLLQKNPDDNVKCHVTGFLFRNITILWRTNGRDINSSSKFVETGETLPNEDGTFQRTLTLYVLPDKWKKSQYTCEVEHQSLTETIQKILTVNEIESNEPRSDASYNMYLVVFLPIIPVVLLIGLCVHRKHRKILKAAHEKYKCITKPPSSDKEQTEALHSDSSTPSSCPSTSEPSPSQFLTSETI